MKYIHTKYIVIVFIFFLVSCKKEHKTSIKNTIEHKTELGKKEIVKTDSTDNAKPSLKKENQLKDSLVKRKVKKPIPRKAESKKPIISKSAKTYRFRKYDHVTNFYEKLSVDATQVCMDQNVPPAALLAVAGLESGWNSGYIGQITGNILSLGASKRRGDAKLPGLTLPRLKKTKKIVFDSLEIATYNKNTYYMERRPSSLKKDYRPKRWAGTQYNLGYFEHHPEEKAKAHAQNIEDFVTVFISRTSKISAYRNTRAKMDALVKKHGKDILLKETTARQFIHGIGGKKNSYNYRETWPIKVINIMRKAGLVSLTTDLYSGKSFKESW